MEPKIHRSVQINVGFWDIAFDCHLVIFPGIWYIFKMNQCIGACLTIFFVLAVFLLGCQSPVQESETIPTAIEGRIYLVGNEPFTELAIQTKGEEVYTLRGHLILELKALQGHWVQLQGAIIKDQQFLYSSKGFLVEDYSHKPLGGEIDEKDTH